MTKLKRGFASMSRNVNRAISKQGGISAHKKGTAHEWTPQEAKMAGRIGGLRSGKRRIIPKSLIEARMIFLETLNE